MQSKPALNWWKWILRLLAAASILPGLWKQHDMLLLNHHSYSTAPASTRNADVPIDIIRAEEVMPIGERCAINFFGLPRAFESLVLPSLIPNVIRANAAYNCDYFIHYYHLEQESAGRSGRGGAVNPEEIFLLTDLVMQAQQEQLVNGNNSSDGQARRTPVVKFTVTKEEDFWKQYQPLLDRIQHTKDKEGKPLYFPWRERTYRNPSTTNNVIKMWHSIESVWNCMSRHAQEVNDAGLRTIEYTQVAVIRSDALYMTPIDLYEYGTNRVVVPGFGRYPVSDRLVYGPASAVRIWASERFSRLEEHIQYMYQHERGWGLHSERYVQRALFPAMREALLATNNKRISSNDTNNSNSTLDNNAAESLIVEHPQLCFFRARADESVWVSDCYLNAKPTIRNFVLSRQDNKSRGIQGAVETVLGRACHGKVKRLYRPVRTNTLNCTLTKPET